MDFNSGRFSRPVEVTLLMVADRMEARIPRLLDAAVAPALDIRLLGRGSGCFGGGLRVGPITGNPESESSEPESSEDLFLLLFLFFSDPSLPKVEI